MIAQDIVDKDRKMTKGERTAQSILDAAEKCFAENGYEKTNLREIASEVGIQEPGLYRHFSNKDEIYKAVLERALSPLSDLLDARIEKMMDSDSPEQDLADLPVKVFELFAEHPAVALLFQQALLANYDETNPMQQWIASFFRQAEKLTVYLPNVSFDRQMLALRILALFNVCIGFFSSAGVLKHFDIGRNQKQLMDKQKQLLSQMMQSWQ